MAHRKVMETTDLTVQDAITYHTNMVHVVVKGLQEVLQQDQALTKTTKNIVETREHVANAVKTNQQQLAAKNQQMHKMIQAIHLQYAASPEMTHQDYGGCGYYRGQKNH